jgi:hypothetical protein
VTGDTHPDGSTGATDSLISHLNDQLGDDEAWRPALDALKRGDASLHLAVLTKPFLGPLMNGIRTIESRFSRVRGAPRGPPARRTQVFRSRKLTSSPASRVTLQAAQPIRQTQQRPAHRGVGVYLLQPPALPISNMTSPTTEAPGNQRYLRPSRHGCLARWNQRCLTGNLRWPRWTVRMLTDLRDRIDTESEYQRGQVWSEAQQRLLIDSLLRGYDLPKIYLRKLPEGGSRLYEVVDGKQRLTAIWLFLENEFRLSSNVDIEGLGQLGRKTWSELSATAQDRLQFAKVTVSELEEATSEEVAELFLRLQRGEPLRAAEKRNAILGPVRDFVANRLARLPVFPNLGIPDRRFTWHELGAIALLLTIRSGPTTLKGADLNDLYEDQGFEPDGEQAELTIKWLSQLDAVAQISPGAITTRWGFVDLPGTDRIPLGRAHPRRPHRAGPLVAAHHAVTVSGQTTNDLIRYR